MSNDERLDLLARWEALPHAERLVAEGEGPPQPPDDAHLRMFLDHPREFLTFVELLDAYVAALGAFSYGAIFRKPASFVLRAERIVVRPCTSVHQLQVGLTLAVTLPREGHLGPFCGILLAAEAHWLERCRSEHPLFHTFPEDSLRNAFRATVQNSYDGRWYGVQTTEPLMASTSALPLFHYVAEALSETWEAHRDPCPNGWPAFLRNPYGPLLDLLRHPFRPYVVQLPHVLRSQSMNARLPLTYQELLIGCLGPETP